MCDSNSRTEWVRVLALSAALVAVGWIAAQAQEAAAPEAAKPPPPFAGYWVGKGAIWELALNDAARKLTRRSETDFWFTIDKTGQVRGQGYISYEAELQALKWKIPVAGAGDLNAEVSGIAEKHSIQYEIQGTAAPDAEDKDKVQLALRVEGEQDSVIPGQEFQFVISASVSFAAVAKADKTIKDIKIAAKAWSPFQGLTPVITQHLGGPYTAGATKAGQDYSIEWHAVQSRPRPPGRRGRGSETPARRSGRAQEGSGGPAQVTLTAVRAQTRA